MRAPLSAGDGTVSPGNAQPSGLACDQSPLRLPTGLRSRLLLLGSPASRFRGSTRRSEPPETAARILVRSEDDPENGRPHRESGGSLRASSPAQPQLPPACRGSLSVTIAASAPLRNASPAPVPRPIRTCCANRRVHGSRFAETVCDDSQPMTPFCFSRTLAPVCPPWHRDLGSQKPVVTHADVCRIDAASLVTR